MLSLGGIIFIIVLCLAAEAYFSSSEVAILSAKKTRLNLLAAEGNEKAKLLLTLVEKPERLFGTTLIGTNAATVTAATFLSSYCLSEFGENGDFLAALIFSPLTMLLGEILPKSIAQTFADRYAAFTVKPLLFLSIFLRPVSIIFGFVSRFIGKLVGPPPAREITREDLKLLLDHGFQELDPRERSMINRIWEFREKRVYEVMKPLEQVVSLPREAKVAEAVELIQRSGYSRLPVYSGKVENIVGIINSFDLFDSACSEDNISSFVVPARLVNASSPVDEIFGWLKSEQSPLSVVVNEAGRALGIVSFEDLVEEVVGELEDEPAFGSETSL